LWNILLDNVLFIKRFVGMEREYSQFSPELLQMMRDEEREKFLIALKNGASWGQLYQIRNTIRKLNDMIDAAGQDSKRHTGQGAGMKARSDEDTPRDPSTSHG
jgi:hypothetical protein